MQGIYTYIPETNYVPTEYSVAAILLLLIHGAYIVGFSAELLLLCPIILHIADKPDPLLSQSHCVHQIGLAHNFKVSRRRHICICILTSSTSYVMCMICFKPLA